MEDVQREGYIDVMSISAFLTEMHVAIACSPSALPFGDVEELAEHDRSYNLTFNFLSIDIFQKNISSFRPDI